MRRLSSVSGIRLISGNLYPCLLARAALDGFTELHLVVTIAEGWEVGSLGEIASQDVLIDFGIELLEGIRETFIMTAWIGRNRPCLER